MKEIPTLDRLLDELERRRGLMGRLLKGLRLAKERGGWDPSRLLQTLESARAAPEFDEKISALLDEVRDECKKALPAIILELESDVRELCERQGWTLDGQWPSLHVARAIELTFDEKRLCFAVGGTKLRGLSSEVLRKALGPRVERLLPARFSPAAFMRLFAQAYDATRGRHGDQVPILEVYGELVRLSQPPRFWRDASTKSYVEITAEQLRARLTAALDSGQTSAPDGRELRLLPPIDPTDAIFVYQPAEKRFGFVGRVEFQHVSKANL